MSTIRDMLIRIGVDADTSTLKNVDRGLANIKSGALALGAALVPVALGLRKIVMAGAEAERTEITFRTMLGSAEAAAKMMKDMEAFALETPFTFGEVEKNTKMLLAMGSSAKSVFNDLKMLGDVSAGLNVPIERLALNFGQVRSQGKLTGRELRDFAVAGVPLLDVLSQMTGQSKAAVLDLTSAGGVSFKMVEQAFRIMTKEGGKFNGLMKALSKSTSGVISNFGVLFDLTIRGMGKELNETFFNKFLTNIYDWAKINDNLKNTIISLIKVGTALAGVLALWGIGKMVLGIHALTLALTAMGNAALLAKIKMLAFPILVGTAIAALALIFEDLYLTIKDPEADTYFRDIYNWLNSKIPNALKAFKGGFEFAINTGIFMLKQAMLNLELLWEKIKQGKNIVFGGDVDMSSIRDVERRIRANEMTYNQLAQGNLNTAIGGARGVANTIGSININVNGSGDPKGTADEVLNQLNTRLQKNAIGMGASGGF